MFAPLFYRGFDNRLLFLASFAAQENGPLRLAPYVECAEAIFLAIPSGVEGH
jgi:hypothetical protein